MASLLNRVFLAIILMAIMARISQAEISKAHFILRGTVDSPQQKPIPGVLISVASTDMRTEPAISDSGGKFQISVPTWSSSRLYLEIYWNEELMFRQPLDELSDQELLPGTIIEIPPLSLGLADTSKASVMAPPRLTITRPEGFVSITPQPVSLNRASDPNNLVLNLRFQSSDKQAEFAVIVADVHALPMTEEARAIQWTPLNQGEKFKLDSRFVKGNQYIESFTAEGPGYTRYFEQRFTTGPYSNAGSILWELKTSDQRALDKYHDVYKAFKKSLELNTNLTAP